MVTRIMIGIAVAFILLSTALGQADSVIASVNPDSVTADSAYQQATRTPRRTATRTPRRTATRTPRRTATRTPRRTPTRTPTPVLVQVPAELAVALGGGGGPPPCSGEPNLGTRLEYDAFYEVLCIYGLSGVTRLSVNLYSSEGETFSQVYNAVPNENGVILLLDSDGNSMGYEGMDYMTGEQYLSVSLSVPLYLPEEGWTIEVISDNDYVSATGTIARNDLRKGIDIFRSEKEYSPFYFSGNCTLAEPGQEISVYVNDQPPNARFNLVFYHADGTFSNGELRYVPLNQYVVQSDRNGVVFETYRLGATTDLTVALVRNANATFLQDVGPTARVCAPME